MRFLRRSVALVCFTCLCLGLFTAARAEEAESLADAQSVSAPLCLNRNGVKRLTDGDTGSYARVLGFPGVEVRLADDTAPQGLYLEWRNTPTRFILSQYDGGGKLLQKDTVEDALLEGYYPLSAGTRRVTLTGGDPILELSNLYVYGAGALPRTVHIWEQPASKTDLLVVSAHCDDELLFFGGAIPLYAGERGYTVEVAYMAHGERLRQEEALSGLAVCGVSNAPVFLGFPDEFCETIEQAAAVWNRDKATEALVSLLRQTKPEVVLTHDENGEYGHGAHMLTSACVLDAVRLAPDETAYPDSAKEFGTWQVKKLYRHLGGGEGALVMDWEQPLSAFGGKTALAVADEGFQKHASQLYVYESVYVPVLRNSAFTLVASTVGPDEAKNDFFEHIPTGCLTVGKD